MKKTRTGHQIRKKFHTDKTLNTTLKSIRAILFVMCRSLLANHLIPIEIPFCYKSLGETPCVPLHIMGGECTKQHPLLILAGRTECLHYGSESWGSSVAWRWFLRMWPMSWWRWTWVRTRCMLLKRQPLGGASRERQVQIFGHAA